MTEKETDRLLKQFVQEHKQELPDKGFTRRVMSRLPDREQRLSTIWTAVCLVFGLILFYIFDGVEGLLNIITKIVTSVADNLSDVNPQYLVIAAVILFGLLLRKVWTVLD